jgi:signal transduction histidine kinase
MYFPSGWPNAANRPTLRDMDSGGMDSRWRGISHPPLRDVAIAVVLTIIAFFAAYGEAHPQAPTRYFSAAHPQPNTPPAALLLVVLAGAVLAWRHVYPRTVLCVSTAAVIAYTLPGYVNGVALLLPAVALGTLAVMLPIRTAIIWTVGITAVLMGTDVVNNPLGTFGGGFVLIPANNAVALFAGIAIANRRALLSSARSQAAQAAERETQRRVDEERLRIARELHDVVAHTMATITVQAAAATQLIRDRPDEAVRSLQAIRNSGKDGLRELRAILNVLRNADEPADPTAPTAGLTRLDALAAGVRAAGVPVTVTVTGAPRDLPVVVDLAAYRIIQEALTNVIRHAGPATARVSLGYSVGELFVEITDTGRGPAAAAADATFDDFISGRADGNTDGGRTAGTAAAGTAAAGSAAAGSATAGHGLRGMRERAMAAGGSITIGRAAEGGFRVAARFPLDAEPRTQPLPAEAGQPDVPNAHATAPAQKADS